MDYRKLAEELLSIQTKVPHVKAERRILKAARGRAFVLSYLAANGNKVHPKDLSDSMMVSTARIAAILGQLEKEDIVTRTTDPDDNRQVIVKLTDKGIEMAGKYHERVLGEMTGMLEFLGPEDAQEYVRIRKKLMDLGLEKAR